MKKSNHIKQKILRIQFYSISLWLLFILSAIGTLRIFNENGVFSFENIKNVIIVSVIFDNSNVDLDVKKIKEKYDSIKSQKENITIVCIRKKTIDKIIEIIKGVRTNE